MTKRELMKALEKIDDDDQVFIQDPEEFYLRKIEDIYPIYQSNQDNYFREKDELPKKEKDRFKKSLLITCKDHV